MYNNEQDGRLTYVVSGKVVEVEDVVCWDCSGLGYYEVPCKEAGYDTVGCRVCNGHGWMFVETNEWKDGDNG